MYLTDKFVFIHQNKCAGVTIKDFMLRYLNAEIVKYKHAPIRMLPEKFRKRVKIGCIRDPFAWYVSYFTYLKESGHIKDLSWNDFIFSRTMTSRKLLAKPEKKILKKYPNVRPPRTTMPIGGYTFHYIHYFCYDARNVLANWDYNYFRLNINKISNLDVTLRTEHLKDDMKKVFGFEKEIDSFPKKNKSKHSPYMEFYNPEQEKLVMERDGALIRYLGYR